MVITMLSIPFPEDEKQTNSNLNIPQPRCWKLKKNRRRGQGTWNELICDQLFGEPERNYHGMANFKLDKNPVKTHQQNYFGGKSGGENAKRCEYLFVNKRNMDRMCTWSLNGWAIQLFCAQISFFWSAEAPIAQLCKRKDHLVPKCQSQNSNVQAQPDATVWQTKHLFVSKWFHFTLGHIVDFSKGESFRNCFNQELWFRNIFEHQIADSKTCNSQEFPNTSVWRWTLRCSPVSWALETSTDSLEHVLAEK